MCVNTDRVVTIGYILLWCAVLMLVTGDGQSPSYSVIAKVLMTISLSAILSAAGVLIWSKLRFF